MSHVHHYITWNDDGDVDDDEQESRARERALYVPIKLSVYEK